MNHFLAVPAQCPWDCFHGQQRPRHQRLSIFHYVYKSSTSRQKIHCLWKVCYLIHLMNSSASPELSMALIRWTALNGCRSTRRPFALSTKSACAQSQYTQTHLQSDIEVNLLINASGNCLKEEGTNNYKTPSSLTDLFRKLMPKFQKKRSLHRRLKFLFIGCLLLAQGQALLKVQLLRRPETLALLVFPSLRDFSPRQVQPCVVRHSTAHHLHGQDGGNDEPDTTATVKAPQPSSEVAPVFILLGKKNCSKCHTYLSHHLGPHATRLHHNKQSLLLGGHGLEALQDRIEQWVSLWCTMTMACPRPLILLRRSCHSFRWTWWPSPPPIIPHLRRKMSTS